MNYTRLRRLIAACCLLFFLFSAFPDYAHAQNPPPVTGDVVVSAKVGASPNDFSAVLTERSNTGGTVRPNTGMDFTITYASHLSHAELLTVEAEWSLGTINGETTPSLPVLAYKNSASNGYNFTQPIVDLINRKITWTIPNFPGETEHQVHFSLETTNTVTATTPVSFSVRARVIAVETATPDSIIIKNYRNISDATTSSSNTSPADPTPTPPVELTFESVAFQTIATNGARLTVRTSQPAIVVLRYGEDQRFLRQQLVSPLGTIHSFSLPSLQPGKHYYLRFETTDVTSRKITSNLYSFTTAIAPPEQLIQNTGFLLSANGVILHFPGSELNQDAISAVIPQHMLFSLQLRVTKPGSVQALFMRLENTQVLGAASPAEQNTVHEAGMVLLRPGVFSGQLFTGTFGTYTLVIQTYDTSGNITEYPLTRIRITPPMSVKETGGNTIEKAKVTLYRYDPVTRLYTFLPQQSGIHNPLRSDHNGIVVVALPLGEYKAQISALGYETLEKHFTIGAAADSAYPLFSLNKQPFSLATIIQYITDVTIELYAHFERFVGELAVSSRYFTVGAAVILGCFILLTLLAFTARTHIPLYLIPAFVFHHLLIRGSRPAIISGIITDQTSRAPLRSVRVALIDAGTGTIQTQTVTDSKGRFIFKTVKGHGYRIYMIKTGYQQLEQVIHTSPEPVMISLARSEHFSPWHAALSFVRLLMSMLLEILLFMSLLLEVIFAQVKGIGYALPFMLLSIINLCLWLYYLYHERWRK